MKAMVIRQYGDPDVFEEAEIPEPQVRPGHLLVRVAASSVNPIDFKIRSGAVPGVSPPLPAVLHGDVAGVVEAVGEGVVGFQPGDEVYACGGGVKGPQPVSPANPVESGEADRALPPPLGGALAEKMLVDAALVAHRPRRLSLLDAAAVPLVGITAWESLVDRVRIEPGQRVLVHAGAGGVGHLGVQLARLQGAIVYATVSSDAKAKIARDLGADVTINYREEAVADYVQRHTGGAGFDVVYDTVGGECLAASFQAVRIGGTVATIAARSTQDLAPLHGKNVTLHCVIMLVPLLTGKGRAHHGEILRRLALLIDEGRLRPLLDDDVFDFAEVASAHRKLEWGTAIGKVRLRSPW